MLHVVAVFMLATFLGGGRTYIQSTHLTAEACQDAMAQMLETRRGSPVVACIPGMLRIEEVRPLPVETGKPAPGTRRTSIGSDGRTCTGDDRFCGRL